MKTFSVEYYERFRGRDELVCWTVKAMTKEDAEKEFLYALACGEIYKFNDKKGIVAIDECH